MDIEWCAFVQEQVYVLQAGLSPTVPTKIDSGRWTTANSRWEAVASRPNLDVAILGKRPFLALQAIT